MPATSSTGADDPPAEVLAPRDRMLLRRGILGAVVAFVALSAIASLAARPFLPADESSNADYALAAADGRIPGVDQPVVPRLPGQHSLPLQYVANHPPLYYLLAGIPLRLGLALGQPMVGVYAARLLTVLLSAGAVLLTGVLAASLTAPRRRLPVAVGAAALVATSSWLVLTSGIIHNDGLAATLLAAQLVATVLVLRDGLRAGPCLLLVASAALGMLTRISALSLVALSAAALVAAGLLHPAGGRRRGLRRGVGWAALLLATCALTSGWFYLRNLRRYGSPTAQDYVVDRLQEHGQRLHTPPSVAEVLLDLDTYGQQVLRMFGAYAANGLPASVQGPASWLIAGVWLAVAAGIVAAAVTLARAGGHRRGGRPGGDRPAVEAAIWTLLGLHVVAVFLQIANHVAEGGAANGRYLFPAWPVLTVVMAAAILWLPGRLGRVLLALVVAAQAGLTVALLMAQAARWTGGPVLTALPKAVRLSGVPAPDVVLVGLAVLATVGLGTAVAAVLRSGGRTPGGYPVAPVPRPERSMR